MSPFEKLVNRILVHEAFDKPYPPKIPRTREEIDKEMARVDTDYHDALGQQSSSAFSVRADIARNRLNKRSELNYEIEDRLASDKQQNPSDAELRAKIIEEALKRNGSPNKEYMQLPKVQEFIQTFIDSLYDPDPSIKGISQSFSTKDYTLQVSMKSHFNFDERTEDIIYGEPIKNTFTKEKNNGRLSIFFKPIVGKYLDVTGSNDASRIVATVMEFAFAVFSVAEASLKILYPEFYEFKLKNSTFVIDFSGAPNFAVNTKSKTVRDGMNKRNRLYTLGWKSFQKRKGIKDLDIDDTGTDTIYIKYKEAPDS